jgi:hypothetical protein
MTYRELILKLQEMSDSQLDMDVTIFDSVSDEFHPMVSLEFANENIDVLDNQHPFINF